MNQIAETDDWALIARLLHQFNTEFGEPISPVEILTSRLAGLSDLRALVIGDPPHGFVALRFRASMYDDAPECHLAEFYVAPGRRGHGDGTLLLRAALELARDAGATHIELNTDPDDHAAHHVYERAGFRRTAHYYEREL